MPKKVVQPGTPSQIVTWDSMRYGVVEWDILPDLEREAYKRLVRQSHMSGRDYLFKTIMEDYAVRPGYYAGYRVEWQDIGEEETVANVYVHRIMNVRYNVMNRSERYSLLFWEEISPSLRGKRLLRRWKLRDRSNKAHRSGRVNVYPKGDPAVRQITFVKSNGDLYLFMKCGREIIKYTGTSGLYEVPYL